MIKMDTKVINPDDIDYVVYIDREFNPVSEDKAEVIKVVLKDGKVIFGYPDTVAEKHLQGQHDQKTHAPHSRETDWQGRTLKPGREIMGGNLTPGQAHFFDSAAKGGVSTIGYNKDDIDELARAGLIAHQSPHMRTDKFRVYKLTIKGREVLEQYLRVRQRLESTQKHLGPGPHPDGTPQSVHAGGSGHLTNYMKKKLGAQTSKYSLIDQEAYNAGRQHGSTGVFTYLNPNYTPSQLAAYSEGFKRGETEKPKPTAAPKDKTAKDQKIEWVDNIWGGKKKGEPGIRIDGNHFTLNIARGYNNATGNPIITGYSVNVSPRYNPSANFRISAATKYGLVKKLQALPYEIVKPEVT